MKYLKIYIFIKMKYKAQESLETPELRDIVFP